MIIDFLIAVSLALPAGLDFDFEYVAVLDASEEVTAPMGDVDNAVASGSIDVEGTDGTYTITWEIFYDGLTGPLTAAHIHGPAMPGESASPIVDLLANGTDTGSLLTGSFEVVGSNTTAVTIRDGLSYVNLHTATNGGGEVRGQVVPPGDFFREAGLDVNQSGAMNGNLEDAKGSGTVIYTADTEELFFNISYEGLTGVPTVAHIHGPANFGQTAGVLVDLDQNGLMSPIIGNAVGVDPTVLAHIAAGLTYVNIHTMMNGPGEIRGQVLPIVFANGFEGGLVAPAP